MSGFEASNFSSDDFAPITDENGTPDKRAWFNCPASGCGKALDAQLAKNPLAGCKQQSRTGIATVEVEGWVADGGGGYGHMNRYPRELFVERVLHVGPPPEKLVQEWLAAHRKHGICDT